jgi:hypothetical protein
VQRAVAVAGQRPLFRAVFEVVGRLGDVRDLPQRGVPGAAGLGSDGGGEPGGGVGGRAVGVDALQQAQPDGLFEVAGFGRAGVGLRRDLGGDAGRDAAARACGCRGGRASPQPGPGCAVLTAR